MNETCPDSYTGDIHMSTAICQDCGRRFSYRMKSGVRRRFCDDCRVKRRSEQKRRDRESWSRDMVEANDCAFNYPDANTIMDAKTKPAGVSDTRWRMELRRRANADFYAMYGDPL